MYSIEFFSTLNGEKAAKTTEIIKFTSLHFTSLFLKVMNVRIYVRPSLAKVTQEVISCLLLISTSSYRSWSFPQTTEFLHYKDIRKLPNKRQKTIDNDAVYFGY